LSVGAAAVFIKLKFIRCEKDGRIYLRRNGRCIRLKEKPGTEAFHAEYERALSETNAKKLKTLGSSRESLGWLCLRYFASADFKRLAPSSQAARRRILERICDEHGDKPYARMEARHVRDLRDEKPGPEPANSLVKALRGLFAWAVEADYASSNPAKAVPKLRCKGTGFHTWTLEEVRTYEERHPPGTKPRLALALLLYTGARRGDAIRLGRQMIKNGWLTFTAEKTGITVSIPVLPELQAELDRAPRGNMTFLLTAYGKPFTAAGFGMRFREWCNQAGLPHCSAHGLRKAGATVAAERGASEAQLNAIFGWGENSNESRRYTRAARQKVLAASAMTLLSTTENGTATVPFASSGTESEKKAKEIK
jgi:integrase